MRKGLFCLILSVALVFSFAGYTWSDEDDLTIMHPDRETRLRWIRDYEIAPKAYIDEDLRMRMPPHGSKSLLSHLQYTPAQRNQGSCGNCWAWAGTGVMGIDLAVQEGILDRLSVQYINSCETSIIGITCCAGGWLSDVADFYNNSSIKHAIPWSNTNAHWQDGDASCDTPSGSISTSPNYPITSISDTSITTYGVSQATAIANIKNVLDQNKAVWFGFFLPHATAWNNFRSFWSDQGKNVTWQADQWCGESWVGGGGHAVLCVGYNDDDPDNRYWIMLNSWGTAGGDRPNGLFRVDMDMNYSCTFWDGGSWYSFYWQTLDIDWGISNGTSPIADDDSYEIEKGETLVIASPGVLENDNDDGDVLTAHLVNDVSNGNLALNLDGSFTYTPNQDYHGTDSFTYRASDGENDSNIATVTISVYSNSNPIAAYNNGLAVDFGSSGMYYYNGTSWSQLSTNNPQWLTVYNGNLAADFGATYGLYQYDGISWTQISTSDADNTGNTMVAYNNGLAVDFGSLGLWYYNGTSWSQISTNNPQWLTAYNGNLAVDFGTYGLYSYNGSTWTRISTADADNTGNTMVSCNNGLAVDFGTQGLYYYNDAAWSQISTHNAELAAYNGSLVADFGNTWGLWQYDGSAWSQISIADPDN